MGSGVYFLDVGVGIPADRTCLGLVGVLVEARTVFAQHHVQAGDERIFWRLVHAHSALLQFFPLGRLVVVEAAFLSAVWFLAVVELVLTVRIPAVITELTVAFDVVPANSASNRLLHRFGLRSFLRGSVQVHILELLLEAHIKLWSAHPHSGP